MRSLAILLTSFLLAASAPISSNTSATYLSRPFGKTNALVSPDGKHALWGDDENSQLHIEDTATHTSRPVVAMTVQTLSLAWSPDNRYFAVNDRAASDIEDATFSTRQRWNASNFAIDYWHQGQRPPATT